MNPSLDRVSLATVSSLSLSVWNLLKLLPPTDIVLQSIELIETQATIFENFYTNKIVEECILMDILEHSIEVEKEAIRMKHATEKR